MRAYFSLVAIFLWLPSYASAGGFLEGFLKGASTVAAERANDPYRMHSKLVEESTAKTNQVVALQNQKHAFQVEKLQHINEARELKRQYDAIH